MRKQDSKQKKLLRVSDLVARLQELQLPDDPVVEHYSITISDRSPIEYDGIKKGNEPPEVHITMVSDMVR